MTTVPGRARSHQRGQHFPDEDHRAFRGDPVRELAVRVLERTGYRVLAACDGEEAFAVHAAADGVDLGILDQAV